MKVSIRSIAATCPSIAGKVYAAVILNVDHTVGGLVMDYDAHSFLVEERVITISYRTAKAY